MLVVMTICQDCDREMLSAASCTVSALHLQGVAVPLVPYGPDGTAGPTRTARCGDCGVELGGFHHLGCDLVACPSCRGQLLSCGCPFDEFGAEQDDEQPQEDGEALEVDGPEERNPCPVCRSTAVIPILYGRPNPALEALSSIGLVELAGRSFLGVQPSSRCRDCGHAWSRAR